MKRHKSMILIFDGIDGSGKNTLTERLQSYLESLVLWGKDGYRMNYVERFEFPNYNSICGNAIKTLINKELDEDLTKVIATLFALDRKIFNYGKDTEDRIKIFDRYYPSNWAYNNLPLDWLMDLEKESYRGDVVFILDVDPEESFKRRQERRDNYEKNIQLLTQARYKYLELARTFGWVVLDGTKDVGQLVNEVTAHITSMNHGLARQAI